MRIKAKRTADFHEALRESTLQEVGLLGAGAGAVTGGITAKLRGRKVSSGIARGALGGFVAGPLGGAIGGFTAKKRSFSKFKSNFAK